MIGLIHAVKIYDPRRKCHFSTISWHCIRRALQPSRKAAELARFLPLEAAPDPGAAVPEFDAGIMEQVEDLRRELPRLTRRQREIISRRFGLGGRPPETLEQVGRRLGISREAVRMAERKVLDWLRTRMRRRERDGAI